MTARAAVLLVVAVLLVAATALGYAPPQGGAGAPSSYSRPQGGRGGYSAPQGE